MYVSEKEDDWDVYLASVMFAYRAAPHETTGISPFRAMFGYEARLPVDVEILPQPGKTRNISLHLKDLAAPIVTEYAYFVN